MGRLQAGEEVAVKVPRADGPIGPASLRREREGHGGKAHALDTHRVLVHFYSRTVVMEVGICSEVRSNSL